MESNNESFPTHSNKNQRKVNGNVNDVIKCQLALSHGRGVPPLNLNSLPPWPEVGSTASFSVTTPHQVFVRLTNAEYMYGGMTKEKKALLKQDPQRYQHYLKLKRESRKRRLERIRQDPKRLAAYQKSQQRKAEQRKKQNKLIRDQRRSRSAYWQVSGYQRYKRRYFSYLARLLRIRCKTGKRVNALELFGIAKKQRLLCPLTGEKLTRNNISIDHIMPLTRGGTNALDNLRFIVRSANTAKHTMSDAEFLSFCQNIVNHSTKTLPRG